MNGLVDPENPQQIVVQKSAAISLLGVAFRQIGLIGGSITTLFSLVSAHDIRGLFDYLGGSEFFLVVGIVITLGVAVWGYVRSWISHKQKLIMARIVPDRVAVVVDKVLPTKVGGSGT